MVIAAVWVVTTLLGLGLFLAAARTDRQFAVLGFGTTPPSEAAIARDGSAKPSIRAVA